MLHGCTCGSQHQDVALLQLNIIVQDGGAPLLMAFSSAVRIRTTDRAGYTLPTHLWLCLLLNVAMLVLDMLHWGAWAAWVACRQEFKGF